MKDFRPELIDILKEKVTEGLGVIATLNVADKDYANSIVNLLNTDKTIAELEAQLKFDAEEKAKDIATVEDLLKDKEDVVMGDVVEGDVK